MLGQFCLQLGVARTLALDGIEQREIACLCLAPRKLLHLEIAVELSSKLLDRLT